MWTSMYGTCNTVQYVGGGGVGLLGVGMRRRYHWPWYFKLINRGSLQKQLLYILSSTLEFQCDYKKMCKLKNNWQSQKMLTLPVIRVLLSKLKWIQYNTKWFTDVKTPVLPFCFVYRTDLTVHISCKADDWEFNVCSCWWLTVCIELLLFSKFMAQLVRKLGTTP